MRLYTPSEFIDCVSRNWWEFIRAVSGHVDLDPEQEGEHWVRTVPDWGTWAIYQVAVLVVFITLGFLGGWPGMIFWFLCPAFACMFFELGFPEDSRAAYSGRGPRVWLSRWYLSTLAVALVVLPVLDWIRWIFGTVWAVTSYFQSQHYRSTKAYYLQHKRENPNRDHYRIHWLAFEYLCDGQEMLAAEEYAEVLKADPDNWKALLMVRTMQGTLAMQERGFYGVGFTCRYCQCAVSAMLSDGLKISKAEHDALFLRICPACGQTSEMSYLST